MATCCSPGAISGAASFPLPAVACVTEKAAEPRFPNFKNIMAAKKKPLESWSLSDLGIQAGPEQASVRSVMVSAQARPEKQAGPKVTDDGTAAAQLVDFLAGQRLHPLLDVAPADFADLLYPFYESHCGQVIASAKETLTVDSASAEVARSLGIAQGQPVVVIERLALGFDRQPLEWRRSCGAADTFSYQVDIC